MTMKLHTLKQWGFTALLLFLIAVLEGKAAIGAYMSVSHADGQLMLFGDVPLAAVQHSALSLICALLAFFTFGFAGRLKDDERPHVAARAFPARIVALCFLFVPIGYLGSALKADRLTREWEVYQASDAYKADLATVADFSNDIYLREEARQRLTPPGTPNLTIADFEWWMAGAVQFLLIFASDVLRVPAPVTEAEVKHWRSVAAGRKAAATRKRNADKRAAAKRAKEAKERRSGFRLLKGAG